MSVELQTGDGWVPSGPARPTLSGDLPTVLEAAPMFRRAVVGYDRFQVDTYVRWAEDELATAAREREHLLGRALRTQTALDDAQLMLSHTATGGDFLRASDRIGVLLAAAADQAEAMRADAEADRATAAAQLQDAAVRSDRALADAVVEAQRVVAAAVARADLVVAEAAEVRQDAERTRAQAGVEAAALVAAGRDTERLAAARAEELGQRAAADVAAARLSARDEVVRMLATGREQRRRADAEAAAARDQLDQEAAARRAGLLAEVADLERRRAALATPERTADPAPAAVAPRPLPAWLPAWLPDRLHRRPASRVSL